MNATEILVIILSSFLALFLLIGIVLAVLLVKVTLQIRRITERADRASANVESMVANMAGAASKATLGKFFLKGARAIYSKRKGGK